MANGKTDPASVTGLTIREVCREHLKEAKDEAARGKVSSETYGIREVYSVDFCEGVSRGGRRVHKGFGDLAVSELNRSHVKVWLDSHRWNGSRRIAYQSLRRHRPRNLLMTLLEPM